MLNEELRRTALNMLRGVAARQGEDPRLVQDVTATHDPVRDGWRYGVVLSDGRRGEVHWGDDMAVGERALRLFAEAGGRAWALPAVASGGDGLSSDYWWHETPMAHADAARRWVRWRLLRDPHMTDSACDRFIASLDPQKRDDLVRRAVEGRGVEGF